MLNANVLITPQRKIRSRMLRNVFHAVMKDPRREIDYGPSLEVNDLPAYGRVIISLGSPHIQLGDRDGELFTQVLTDTAPSRPLGVSHTFYGREAIYHFANGFGGEPDAMTFDIGQEADPQATIALLEKEVELMTLLSTVETSRQLKTEE